MLFEQTVEAFFILISKAAADIGNLCVRGEQHILCLAKTDIFQQIFEIPPCMVFDQPGAIGCGKMEMLCQIV